MAVRRGLAEAVLRRWRRVRDPADVPSVQGAPPAAAPPPPPQFQFAPIPLPDGMAAHCRLAAPHAWGGRGSAAWVVRLVPCECAVCVRVAMLLYE